MKAAMKEAKRFGRKIRRVEVPGMEHCFFAGEWLYVVFENPRSFPPQMSRAEREALISLGHISGRYSPIALSQVEHHPPDPPKVIRSKNLPSYNSYYHPRLGP